MSETNIWKITPGKKGHLWEECVSGGYICIGWMEDHDLKKYKSFDELKAAYLVEHPRGPGDPQPDNDTSSLWAFANDVSIGDVVIANAGSSIVKGIGIIISDYLPPNAPDNPRAGNSYDHVRRVSWLKSTDIILKGNFKHFDIKTVTKQGCSLIDGELRGATDHINRMNEILKLYGLKVNDFQKECIDMKNKLRHITDYISLVEQFKQVIFCGPPGTSKTYFVKRLTAYLIGIDPTEVDKEEKDNTGLFADKRFSSAGSGQWSIVQFHPSYNYEDFVRGIQISTPSVEMPTDSSPPQYKTVNKIIAEMADTASKDKDKKKYVLIIDEINRAHLAAVLGELIYALEYRRCPVDSPYAIDENRQIMIPDNLYILGTMNTADRSVGHIDYAVRRRFAFVPLPPDITIICTEYGRKLFHEVAKLFWKDPNNPSKGKADTLSPEFHPDDVQPGHTYFITKTCEEQAMKFTYQIYPLLREYYKDGVLIRNPELKDLKINIDKPEPHTEILKKVRYFLGCNKGAGTSEADSGEEGYGKIAESDSGSDSKDEVEPSGDLPAKGIAG